MFCKAQVVTQVGGILWENTTWTAANSPYVITGTVQVPSNVTLTIEAGVTVTTSMNPSNEYLFLLNGKIFANGKSNSTITFDAKGSGLISAGMSTADAFTSLDHCIIKGATHIWDSRGKSASGYGHFNLTNSKIQGIENSILNIYLPARNIFIEYNTFEDTSIAIGNDANVYIRHNLFNGKMSGLHYLIQNYDSGQDRLFVQYNSFINMEGRVLSLGGGLPTSGMDARYNYWGTTDLDLIKSMIHDSNTDITCPAAINYLPILQEPDPKTPTHPDIIPPTPTPTESLEPTATPSHTINLDDFCIESNSSVSAFSFDSALREIHFTVNGESGTTGYTNITIAKSFMPTSNINVYLDENQISYDLASNENSWIVTFTYNHSMHHVTITESATIQGAPESSDWIMQAVMIAVALSLIVVACALIWVGKVKQSSKNP